MVDIDTHRIIDLLDSRNSEDVAKRLNEYPNLEIISRDGGTMYQSASTIARPNAIQISDRFHVLKNLTESVVLIIKKKLPKIVVFGEDREKYDEALKKLNLATARTEKERNKQQEARENKIKIIRESKKIYANTNSYKEVSRILNISEPTAKKYVNCEKAEDCIYKASQHKSRLTLPYENTIKELDEKGFSGHAIYNIIKKSGYEGCHSNVKDYLKRLHKEKDILKNVDEKLDRKHIIKAVFYGCEAVMEKVKNKENIDIKNLFEKLFDNYPLIKNIFKLLDDFKKIMFEDKNPNKLDDWIAEAQKVDNNEINEFINGIKKDITAVKNGIKYSYNNGLAEGSVNKIKVIKRIMYGRCGFDLLKPKVLLQY